MIDNINVGLTPNDGLGDTLRDAFIIVNSNFAELNSIVSGDTVSQAEFDAAIAAVNDSLDDLLDLINTKANLVHTHVISDIIGLQTILNGLVTQSTFNLQIAAINASIAVINSDLATIEGNILDLQLTDVSLQNQINDLKDDFIPITGTTAGNPITGDIEFQDGANDNKIYHKQIADNNFEAAVIFTDGSVTLNAHNDDENGDLKVYPNLTITDNPLNAKEFIIDRDHTNIELGTEYASGVDKISMYVEGDGNSYPENVNNQLESNLDDGWTITSRNGDNQSSTSITPFNISLVSSGNTFDITPNVTTTAKPIRWLNSINGFASTVYINPINVGDIDLYLPASGGTLSTEEYVNTKISQVTWNQVVDQGNTVTGGTDSFIRISKNDVNGEFLRLNSFFTGDQADYRSKFEVSYTNNEWFRYNDASQDVGNGMILLPDGVTDFNSFDDSFTTDLFVTPQRVESMSTRNATNGYSSFVSDSEFIEFKNSQNGSDFSSLRFDDVDGLSLSTTNGDFIATLKADLLSANRNFQFPNYSGTLTTQEYADGKLLTKQNLPTGFLTGLTLSIHPGDNTKFDIATGAYIITDFSNLQAITTTIVQVNTPITGITPQYLTVSGVNASFIALDVNQNVIQSSSPFDNAQRRSLAILGAVIHSNHVNINVTNEIKAPIVAPTNQLHDFIRAIGSLNLSGNVYSANGANLQLDKSAGQIWGLGINGGNFMDPHRLTLSGQTGLTFRYRLSNGTEFADTNVLNPTQYESAPGVLTALSNNNRWSIQHINIFQSGLSRVQYGQHEYTSFDQAIAKMFTDSFTVEQNIAENSIFRAYVVTKKTTTDLAADIAAGNAAIVSVDKFGNAIGGPGNALTLAAIVAALGYTPEDVANKVTSLSSPNNTTYPTTQAVVNGFLPKDSSYTSTIVNGIDTNAIIANASGITWNQFSGFPFPTSTSTIGYDKTSPFIYTNTGGFYTRFKNDTVTANKTAQFPNFDGFVPMSASGTTYTTQAIRTMTQAEYNAISGSTNNNTLYFII